MSHHVALVTGAGSGIGRAIALRMAAAGAKVGMVGRDRDALARVAAQIETAGGHAVPLQADVTSRDAINDAVEALVKTAGPITALFNNAGSGKSAAFAHLSVEVWNEMLAVNLTSVFHVTQAVLPHMLAAGRGRIVNIASIAGLKGYPYIAAYAAAKHGVIGLTRALAVELAGKNITANAICPGYVDTPMTQNTIKTIVEKTGRSAEEARRQIESFTPQRRIFDPDEVAALAVYLCTEDARGINGQAIPLCGGEMAS